MVKFSIFDLIKEVTPSQNLFKLIYFSYSKLLCMAKYYQSKEFNTIGYLANKNNIPLVSLAKSLNVTKDTLRKYFNNPFLMSLEQLTCLSGMFGLRVELLCYLLIRNKTQVRSKDKIDKWYIEDVRIEGEKLLGEFPRE